MKIAATLGAGVLTLWASLVQAQTDVEKAIDYRQGVYRAMDWNLSPLAAMVQGRVEFDAAAFAERSERIRLLGSIVAEGFADADSGRGDTRASYRVWTNRDQFDELMTDMQARSKALSDAARAGKPREALRPLLGQLGQSCKACHDRFRD
ncbi:c-type cytochrome [Marinobacterium weihaiense]|uniref:Cytochrome c n=1 Tax=Marinobacterium weihaiense TaxID=2851016 RepID=A0ABS6MDB2_9GAMM|nr:cytochrome c [Marinobacterium weihaiense]MBV0934291.1 cytochrome c [Marinobacterium weihaiense]